MRIMNFQRNIPLRMVLMIALLDGRAPIELRTGVLIRRVLLKCNERSNFLCELYMKTLHILLLVLVLLLFNQLRSHEQRSYHEGHPDKQMKTGLERLGSADFWSGLGSSIAPQ